MSISSSDVIQLNLSNTYLYSSSLFGSSSSSNQSSALQNISGLISPDTLSTVGEAAAQKISEGNSEMSNMTNVLTTFSSYANSLYQSASTLSSSNSNDGSNTLKLSSDDINNFVDSYNKMISYANSNEEYLNSNVKNSLTESYNSQALELSKIGITQNSDNTLSVNQDTLNDAIQNNPELVRSAISSYDGIAANAEDISGEIINNNMSNYANNLSDYSGQSSSIYNNISELEQIGANSSLISGLSVNTFV